MSILPLARQRLKKIVIPLAIMVIFSCALSWLASSQITAQGDISTPTPTVTEVAASSDQTSDSFFALPITIAVLWPVGFVVFTFILNTLVSTGNSADGERKFEVKFQYITSPAAAAAPAAPSAPAAAPAAPAAAAAAPARPTVALGASPTTAPGAAPDPNTYAVYPVGLDKLKEIFDHGDKKVIDIEVLNPGMGKSVSLGIDLCVATVAADLSTIFALAGPDSPNFSTERLIFIISTVVSHTIVALLVALMLKNYKNSIISVWTANILGILSLLSSFYILGYIIQTL